MRRICVFSGSSTGIREEYQQVARALARELVVRGLGLVYGGGGVGLMGLVADAVLAGGGDVIGVLPRSLFRRERVHAHLTELHEVSSMHERKALMADLADGFIALPGGFGTFEELFEILTWAQLGLHRKPVGLLDAAGYFTPLLALVAHASREGFIPAVDATLLMHSDDSASLLNRFAVYVPPINRPKEPDVLPER